MTPIETTSNHRILIIDDNAAIHEDFRKVLDGSDEKRPGLEDAEAALFGERETKLPAVRFEIDSAYQGREGLDRVRQALADGRPYSLAFVDVRMPPGWDGIETISHLWKDYPELQVVICTAYSDYSWDEIRRVLGDTESLVILKKPFDNVEVLQLAHTLTRKWALNNEVQVRMDDLDRLVQERTAELMAANRNLQREMEERAAAQEALRLSEERFSKAFQTTPIPLAILKRGCSTLEDANDSFVELTALDRSAVVKRRLEDLRLWRHPPIWDDLMRGLDRGERPRHQPAETLRPDGSIRQVLLSLEALKVGGEDCLLIIAQDITEQKQLEKQLLQSQKMESIGQLAAGVAHDFNNLLTVIQGHATLHLANEKLDQDVIESLREVSVAAERASGLTRQLLAFSRKKISQTQPLEVAGLVLKLEKMLRRLLGETIELECVSPPALPPIVGEETGIEQILMNLVVNARDAMPKGGRITLTAEEVVVDPAAASSHPDARPGRFVRLSVADNGCGIPADVLPRIFEPFFTTKDVGKGTGLGLSTVYAVVKQHQGWLEVTSVVGQGTTFRVFLPLLSPDARPSSGSHTTLFVKRRLETRGKETLLLVEDENALRNMVAHALQRQGYLVLQAKDAQQGLEVWEKCGHSIDLLLTDVVLPKGVDGLELAQRLQRQKKSLKTLFSSGYSAALTRSDLVLVEGVNFLPKPYDIRKLVETVRRCLDAVEVPRGTHLSEAYREVAELPGPGAWAPRSA